MTPQYSFLDDSFTHNANHDTYYYFINSVVNCNNKVNIDLKTNSHKKSFEKLLTTDKFEELHINA